MKAVRVVDEDGTVRWCTDKRRQDPAYAYMFEQQPEREQAKKDGRSKVYYCHTPISFFETKKKEKKQ